MTSVSTTTVTDPSSVNTESAGVEDAESSQGGKPTQLESGHDLTAEEEALLAASATTLAAPAATRDKLPKRRTPRFPSFAGPARAEVLSFESLSHERSVATRVSSF